MNRCVVVRMKSDDRALSGFESQPVHQLGGK